MDGCTEMNSLVDVRVGVVIPTRNRPRNISKLLVSIEKSTLHPSLCVIVDSSSERYELPECSFNFLFVNPGITGQVNQRNYGFNIINQYSNIEYIFVLDDDIELDRFAISEALIGINKYLLSDDKFVGFSLNIKNLPSSATCAKKILLFTRKPGVVLKSSFNTALSNISCDFECDWVSGGAAVWRKDFICKNPNDYPFLGKAYGEDLYYCSKVRAIARFGAIHKSLCLHNDEYGRDYLLVGISSAYNEGLNDCLVRKFIAKKFPQYSLSLMKLHMLWVGLMGIGYGLISVKKIFVFVGLGRVAGLFQSESAHHRPAKP